MIHSKHRAALTALFGALVIIGLVLLFDGGKKKSVDGTVFDTREWLVYESEQFNFEMRYPAHFAVAEEIGADAFAPKISLYKVNEKGSEKPPFDHFANRTHVSVYPKGIPTEGVMAPRREAQIELKPEINKANDLLLSDNAAFASQYTFSEAPDTWEPWGFLWSRVKIDNLETQCQRNGEHVAESQCDLFLGDNIVWSGNTNDQERALVEAIVQTFRFTK